MAPASNVLFADKDALDEVYTIPRLAKLIGWNRRRLFRHLLALDREQNGTILANVSHGSQRARWTVTLRAVKALHPQWFYDPETIERQLEFVKEQTDSLRARVVRLENTSGMHTQRLVELARASA